MLLQDSEMYFKINKGACAEMSKLEKCDLCWQNLLETWLQGSQSTVGCQRSARRKPREKTRANSDSRLG